MKNQICLSKNGISKEREGDEEITSAKGEEETSSMEITDSSDSGSSEGDAFGAIRPEVSCVPFNRNEWKAIKMFLIGVAPLFLIPLPFLFFYTIYHLTCKYFNFFEQCNDLPWLIPYMFFLLLSLHSLVNPITSLWLNKDFQRPSLIRRR